MTEDFWLGIIGVLGGAATAMNWWFEMFSDSGYAQLCRSITESHGLGRNTTAIIEPAMGLVLLLGGVILLIDDNSPLMNILIPIILLSLAIAALGLIPLRLPAPMYPEWQMEKRRQRAAQAPKKAETIDKDSSSLQHSGMKDSMIPDTSLPLRAQQGDCGQLKQEPRHSTTDHDQNGQ